MVTFDNVGVAATSGTTPNTVEAMAHGAIAFIEAMSFERVDLLGFSIGSFVAQEIALIRPDLLQRVVAGLLTGMRGPPLREQLRTVRLDLIRSS